jgi:hypothetical protein
MVRRLSSRSGGLIEVVSPYGTNYANEHFASDHVQFIHKTFKDFIRIPENIPIVGDEEENDTHFVGCKSLLKASIYVLKYFNADNRSVYKELCNHNTFEYAAQVDRSPFGWVVVPILDVLLESRGHDVTNPGIPGLLIWIEEYDYIFPISKPLYIERKDSSRQSFLRSLQYDLATIAANYGCLTYVQSKISDGLSTRYPKRCPLLWSAVKGYIYTLSSRRRIDHYVALLNFLVDHGAKVGSIWFGKDELQLLLTSSSYKGKLEIIELLLKNGANPNRKFMTRQFLQGHGLWYLVDSRKWYFPIWKLLLQHGASPTIKGGHDHHLLYFAILAGESKIAELLCRAGADPTKLGQGINALRLHQCALAQFTYREDEMKGFMENAIRMQRMLQKFGND